MSQLQQPRVWHGIVAGLDEHTSRLMVAVCDALGDKINRAGGCLPPEVIEARNGIADAITRARTRVGASSEVSIVPMPLALNPIAVVDTATAAQQLGMTDDGVRWLCRTGRLTATKTGRQWWVTTESIAEYLAQNRSRKERPVDVA
jgi:excisionase family DNA binding protein